MASVRNKEMGVTPLISAVHGYMNLIKADPDLSEKVLSVFGYPPNSAQVILHAIDEQLEARKGDQDKLNVLIDALAEHPVIKELRNAFSSPRIMEIYRAMPILPEPPMSAMPARNSTKRQKTSDTTYEYPYNGRPPPGSRWGQRRLGGKRTRKRLRR
jgi:hypothetical protein